MRFIFYFLVLGTLNAVAQSPQVPDRMQVGNVRLSIDEPARREIQESVDALTANPRYFNVHVQRARSYFPIIERVLREEGVPDEFKYLVLQESALIPDAVSSSDAVGFWQFKDFTAIEMGLRVDRTIDERMNIVASTRAAARYLKKNNTRFFDNWIITLMAYQMGPGAAIKAGGEKYKGHTSMNIDRRTYWYIKKFLAHKVAFESHLEGPAELTFIELEKEGGRSLDEIAAEVNTTGDELESYNKWLRKGKIPDDRTYTVLVPVKGNVQPAIASERIGGKENKQVTVVVTESSGSSPSPATSSSYDFPEDGAFPSFANRSEAISGKITEINDRPAVIARRNDRTSTLASRGGISVARFLRYNDMEPEHLVEEGKIYYLKNKSSKPKAHYHVVQPGENLWDVSQKYGMKLKKLQQRNRIRNGSIAVKEGRILWLRYIRPEDIPIEYKEVKKPVVKKTPVVVAEEKPEKPVKEQPGETGSGDVVEKREWNDTNSGQAARVEHSPSKTTDTEPPAVQPDAIRETESDNRVAPDKRILHKVKAGETYYSISRQYGVNLMDMLAWNNLQINDPLSIDQELVVLKYNEGTEEVDKTTEESYYVVKSGDTLYGISRKFNIPVTELKKINDMTNDVINPGDKLRVSK